MKKISQTTLLLAFHLVFGTSANAETLPANLECTSNSTNTVVQFFRLFDLDTTKPRTTLDASFDLGKDQNLQIEKTSVTNFNANNGCDNNYQFVFFSDDLSQLNKGESSSITGMLRFYNSESPDATEMEPDGQTTLIQCKRS